MKQAAADRRLEAELADIVASAGGTLDISRRPVHASGRNLYPVVVVRLGGRSFMTHRATLGLCRDDVTRWLARHAEGGQ